jgi:hypothetical protein
VFSFHIRHGNIKDSKLRTTAVWLIPSVLRDIIRCAYGECNKAKEEMVDIIQSIVCKFSKKSCILMACFYIASL